MLIDPTVVFRFEVAIQKQSMKWTTKGLKLPESCRIPSFGALADRPTFADVRLAWNEQGLGVHLLVHGKRQLPWCRETRPEDSDGFHLWIDTRCSPGIHRATQYCHRFMWMPSGGGVNREQPVAAHVSINRARSEPKPISAGELKVAAAARHDGYELSGMVSAQALTGFDPSGQPRVGIYYAAIDRELGWQTFSLGPEFPVMEDPSLWGEAILSS